jgi:HD-GYP domain-containing protein (c-di-GMP phosphodiesterase class II)
VPKFNRKLLRETYQAVRPIGISVLALAVVACIMAGEGWKGLSLVLAGFMLLLTGVIVVQVHRAVTALRRQSRDLREGAAQAEKHYISVLQRIVHFIEARENYTRGRCERIGNLAEAISRQLGLSEEKCDVMNLAGQFHDIGLLSVSDRILCKRSLLGSKEFQVVQQHSDVSCELLSPLESLAEVLPAIRHHHERMNGTGYPQGLRGQDIPLEARILAVADSYDAMTHDRPHRNAISPIEAMEELRRCTPAGYDEAPVNALAEVIHLDQLAKTMPVSRIVSCQPAPNDGAPVEIQVTGTR